MKKIILLVVMVLMAGIFVGCASTKQDEYIQEFYDAYHPDLRNIDTIKEIVYSPTVSYEEYNEAYKLAFCADKEKSKKLRQEFSTTTNRKDFTGKITNTTDRDAHLKIMVRYTYKRIEGTLPDICFTIPPHETYYFIIENFFSLCEDSIAIQDLDDPEKRYDSGYYVSDFSESPNLYFPVALEIMKTHSLELIYDHNALINDCNKKYEHRFVEPFDDKIQNEKNLIIIHQIL